MEAWRKGPGVCSFMGEMEVRSVYEGTGAALMGGGEAQTRGLARQYS